ncbi:MAG: tRNA pseudouridine(13) synthase TruD [Planctomycetes bacterium]|nr:tRNA pseudouridine(13) synthase TruD [Planctomycetota bacterium]
MRLKTTPEDFRVRELLEWDEVPSGAFVVHRLHKEKLSTPEALSILVRDAQVDRATIAYAGLKDRQAVTDQFLTIERRTVDLRLPNLTVSPVGTTDKPITSKQSDGNAFTIVVRDLRPTEGAQLRRSLPSLVKTGFPNYFDDQRFGSLRHGQGFPMKSVLQGDYERALQQLVAEPSPVAISGDVKLKRALQLRWGDWIACERIARGPAYEPLFRHLVHKPRDFRGALEFVPLRLRVIHAFAFQSYLWNRALSNLLRGGVHGAQRLRLSTLAGDLLAWKYLSPDREQKLSAMRTPLFGVDGDGGSEPFRKVMIEELRRAGLRRQDFVDNEVPGMIWKQEQRDAFVKPRDVADVRIEPDEMNQGNVKATLSFSLPRGAYATMLIKRLFAPSWYSRSPDRFDERGPRRGGRDDRDDRDDGYQRDDRDDRQPRDGGGRGAGRHGSLRPRSVVRYDNDEDDQYLD